MKDARIRTNLFSRELTKREKHKTQLWTEAQSRGDDMKRNQMSFMKHKLIVGKAKMNKMMRLLFWGPPNAAFEMGSCNNPGSSSA